MQIARRLFIGGNWKSTMTRTGALELVGSTLNNMSHNPSNMDVVVFPNNLLISEVTNSLSNPNVHVINFKKLITLRLVFKMFLEKILELLLGKLQPFM